MKKLSSFVIILILLMACRSLDREELESVDLVVTNGVVIDGTGADPIENGLIAIQGNRIVAVGRAADYKIPDDVEVIDAKGGTILPGVINSHSHSATSAASRRILFLLDGVTSVCDLGTPLLHMHHLDEAGIQSGPAARGFKAGPIVTVPGGYPDPPFFFIDYDIQGEDEAEMAVRDLHSRGADYIKVALEPGIFGEPWPVLNLKELQTIVATAHELGLLVRAHVNNAKLDLALDGGVDVIEHVPIPSFSHTELGSFFDDAGVFSIPTELKSQIHRMIEQGIVLVPTLDVIIDDPYPHEEIEPETEVVIQVVLGIVRFFHDSGGIIALGNDYGNPGVKPGMPLREMELLQIVGLSSLEVIEAATRLAAYVCGQSDELGTLEKGKLADLIIVDGNPLGDINAMDSVSYIVKDGELVFSPEDDTE